MASCGNEITDYDALLLMSRYDHEKNGLVSFNEVY